MSAKARAVLLSGLALAAAALSALYVHFYLRGGPRIIDASSYFLEAKMIAEGKLAFPLPEPSTAVTGRFLVADPTFDHAAVIFPPGYPAVLALGFLARAPMAVGPVLAALLVVVTFALGADLATDRDRATQIGLVAAFLSVVCAGLRYHTADTMSHGLAALCFAGAIAATTRAVRGDARFAALAGLVAGWLVATRPVSSVALAITIAALVAACDRSKLGSKALAMFVVATLPGLALLSLHAHAATGSFFGSAQKLYYATSDGPADCFRYGFGANVGCVGEHGDFVRANLKHGFGFVAAAMTTARRLKMHLVDALNAEPLVVLPLYGIFASLRARAPFAKPFAIAILAQVVVYVPFYFDGNYPGGGARFYADVLPLEHAFAAFARVDVARRFARPSRATAGLLALPVLGFFLRAHADHEQLRDRDGGRPLFEPKVLAEAGVDRGLVFLDTDHGFDLAFDPDPRARISFARRRRDASDRATWEALGMPPSFFYRFDFDEGRASVEPFDPSASPARLLGATMWPPRAQRGAFATRIDATFECASANALEIEGDGAVDLAVPSSVAREKFVAPFLAASAGGARVALLEGDHEIASWEPAARCAKLAPFFVDARAADLVLRVEPRAARAVFLAWIDVQSR